MKHLLLPHNQELARSFLKVAISEAERFGVRPENVTPVPVVPNEFKKWLDAAVTIAGLAGLHDIEVIPTWPKMSNDFYKDYPQLTVGSLRGLSEAIEAAADATCEWRGNGDDGWSGTCGIEWYFLDGADDGPDNNGVKFCPRCGSRCVEIGGADADE